MNKSAFVFILLIIVMISGLSCSNSFQPLKSREIHITDGEYLKYGLYNGKDKIGETYIVSRIKPDNKIVIYMDGVFLNSKETIPSNYVHYANQFIVDSKNPALISAGRDVFSNFIRDNRKGPVYSLLEINYENKIAYYTEKNWNGYKLSSKTSRISIKAGYPVWDLNSLFIGFRFMEMDEKGIVYIIIPWIIKEALPVSLKRDGKTLLETKAGLFKTIKFKGIISDPFLGKLLKNYENEMAAWKEDNERGLIIRSHAPWGDLLLEEISALPPDKSF